MQYAVAIEPGSDTHAFGVVVPDLPGCFSAGNTLAETMRNAWDAIVLHLEGCSAAPAPTAIDVLKADPKFRGWDWAYVEVDPADLTHA